jgi:hypothetical protein
VAAVSRLLERVLIAVIRAIVGIIVLLRFRRS